MFSKDVISIFKVNGVEEELARITEIIDFHKVNHISKLKPLPKRPDSLLGQNGLHYLQMSLFRSRKLIEGYLNSLDRKNALTSALVVRAHFEITGATAYFLKKVNNFYANNISFEELESSLRRLTLGVKKKGPLNDAPDPINVMSMIDAADDLLKKLNTDNDPIFRDTYDDLSEFCHPNSFGLFMSSHVNKVGVVRYQGYEADIERRDFIHFFHSFMITANCFKMFYEEARKLIENKEEIPIVIK